MLSDEEREQLEREKCNAKQRCREVYATLVQLRELITTYSRIHDHWRLRAEQADRALAEERVQQVKTTKEEKEPTLTREQILNVAYELGINLEEEDEEGKD